MSNLTQMLRIVEAELVKEIEEAEHRLIRLRMMKDLQSDMTKEEVIKKLQGELGR